MGSILINYPDIPESELVFDKHETREILKFFWPILTGRISQMDVTTDTRRFAQTLMIAAVDGSYAMGFVHGLFDVITRRTPGTGIRVLARRLGTRYVKHWWQHATREDLLDARIYDSPQRPEPDGRAPEWRCEHEAKAVAVLCHGRQQNRVELMTCGGEFSSGVCRS